MSDSDQTLLNEEAAEEFRRAADSPALRRDMRIVRSMLERRPRTHPTSPDDFLQFLTDFSEMCDAAPRKLRVIKDARMVL